MESNYGETTFAALENLAYRDFRLDWYKRALDVNDAIEPSVWNFKRKKLPAWLQYTMNFCEGAILQFARPQMMQDKYGDRRRESTIGKWQ